MGAEEGAAGPSKAARPDDSENDYERERAEVIARNTAIMEGLGPLLALGG
eukprot:gene28669-31846_t